jgi:hypothetical protein
MSKIGSTLRGTILTAGETRQVTDKFSVREFTVECGDDKYSNPIPFQVTNKDIAGLPDLRTGDVIEAEYQLRGRLFRDRCFVNLNVRTVTVIERAAAADAGQDNMASEGNDDPPPF